MEYQDISPLISKFLSSKDFKENFSIYLAGTAGSQRLYYRLEKGIISYILLVSPKSDSDFAKFSRLTQFYRLLDFPVPQIFCIDDLSYQVLLEDLGDVRLYDYTKQSQNPLLPVYKKSIDTLIELQTLCFAKHYESPDILSRIFDFDDLRWETNYFFEEFLLSKLGLKFSEQDKNKIFSAFDNLAQTVDSQPKTIMHRDFQSQNIMVCEGKIRVIDYQGSRLGSRYYDMASLLLDPYQQLEEGYIKELFAYYHGKSLSSLSLDESYSHFLLAGSQRVMQALGAFCFLSEKKGLTGFAKHILPAYKTLKRILKEAQLNNLEKLLLPAIEDNVSQLIS